MININGMHHIMLVVNRFEVARAFYERLLPALGLELVFNGADMVYYVGARTALGFHRRKPEHAHAQFDQGRIGLHHVCFRARSREDVDAMHNVLLEMEAHVVTPPREGGWAPGYYYVLFEDPDGIRIEVAFVPGQGLLADGVHYDPGDDFRQLES